MRSDGSRPGADRGGADGELPAVREDPERQAQEGGALREVGQTKYNRNKVSLILLIINPISESTLLNAVKLSFIFASWRGWNATQNLAIEIEYKYTALF